MAKLEWGIKRTCAACGVRFYDLRKKKITCPECGSEVEDMAGTPPPLNVPNLSESPSPEPVAGESQDDIKSDELEGIDDLETDIDDDLSDADAALMEDTSDIDEKEDVVADIPVGSVNSDDDL